METTKETIHYLNELEILVKKDKQAEEFLTFVYSIHDKCIGNIREEYSLKFLEKKYREIRRKKFKPLKPYIDFFYKYIILRYRKLQDETKQNQTK